MSLESAYVIKWYGPFSCRRTESCWERNLNFKCNLYLIKGKEPNQRKYRYYCGMTRAQQGVFKRFQNTNHPIKSMELREGLEIWVGCLSNIRQSTSFEGHVFLCEKIITSVMTQIELDSDEIKNGTNFSAPDTNVYVINEWYSPEGRKWDKIKGKDVPQVVPDVIAFNAVTHAAYYTERLMNKTEMD